MPLCTLLALSPSLRRAFPPSFSRTVILLLLLLLLAFHRGKPRLRVFPPYLSSGLYAEPINAARGVDKDRERRGTLAQNIIARGIDPIEL